MPYTRRQNVAASRIQRAWRARKWRRNARNYSRRKGLATNFQRGSLMRGNRRYGRTLRIPRGMPSRCIVRMNKTFEFEQPTFTAYTTSANGRIWTSTFTPNDIETLNPSLTAGSARPIQYSEWKNMYNNFYVKRWTCTIKLINHAAPGTEQAAMENNTTLISVFSNSSSAPFTPTTDYTWAQEQDLMKATRKLRFRLKRTKPDYRASGVPVQTMRVTDNSSRLASLDGLTFEDRVGSLLNDSGPPAPMYHHIMVRQPYASSGGTSTAIKMEVSYSLEVMLMDPRTLDPTDL